MSLEMLDVDDILLELERRSVEQRRRRPRPPTWKPGRPFRLYLAGYVGARNTGADIRIREVMRQMQHILREVSPEIVIGSVDLERSAGRFPGARMETLAPTRWLIDLPRCFDGIDAVMVGEGNAFQSTSGKVFAALFAYVLGLANADGKPSVGYGIDSGTMDPDFEAIITQMCRESLLMCRSDETLARLRRLGLRVERGADTAWTFVPSGPRERYAARLRDAGWDRKQPILALCPTDPFGRPARASLRKLALRKLFGAFEQEHIKSLYFLSHTKDNRAIYRRYLRSIHRPVRGFVAKHRVFPIVVGMEAADRRPCNDLARMLGTSAVYVADELGMDELVGILRMARMALSSRFHGIVMSMPAGVVSAGTSMDDRIPNIMRARGCEDLCLRGDDPRLEAKVEHALARLWYDHDALQREIRRVVAQELETMGSMGATFLDELSHVYPQFPNPLPRDDWRAHLPPLHESLQRLLP